MKTKILLFPLFLGACLSSPAHAITIDCSSAVIVNSALQNASSGETVKCSGSGWSSDTVNIPNNKNITLDGSGVSVSGSLNVPSSANFQARVTNFKFTSTARGAIRTGNGSANKPWRMDHWSIDGSTVAIMILGSGPGLIDHLTAVKMASYQQMIQPEWEGPDTEIGWTDSYIPGSPNAIFIEDSTFNHPNGSIWDGSCVIQAYYGSRVIARFNTINTAMLEIHGSPSDLKNVGGRWWEFYNNTFTNGAICIRAGSGLVFNNTGNTEFFVMVEEDPGYPAAYQVGRGQNETLFPAYVWGNSSGIGAPCLNCGGRCAAAAPEMVQLDRDVYIAGAGTVLPATCSAGQGYWKSDAGGNWNTANGTSNDGALYKCNSTNQWILYYTPFTYPHPMQTGTSGTTTTTAITTSTVATTTTLLPPPKNLNVR